MENVHNAGGRHTQNINADGDAQVVVLVGGEVILVDRSSSLSPRQIARSALARRTRAIALAEAARQARFRLMGLKDAANE